MNLLAMAMGGLFTAADLRGIGGYLALPI